MRPIVKSLPLLLLPFTELSSNLTTAITYRPTALFMLSLIIIAESTLFSVLKS